MNIFYLDNDPIKSAELHCDKHVVKMIIEYAQLMSTAHRVLDGELYEDRTANNRRINVGDLVIATWRMLSTKRLTSIIRVLYGLVLVIHTISLCMICLLLYATSTHTDMVECI